MSTSATQLNLARKNLQEAVGDDFKKYLNSMKNWFRLKISKEDFDFEARRLLKPETVHLHNEFLLSMLNKCQTFSSSHATGAKESTHGNQTLSKEKQKKGKVKKKLKPVRATFEHRFIPDAPLSYALPVIAKEIPDEGRVSFCSRDHLLPDLSMTHGRAYLAAWETGLEEVDDDAIMLLVFAVQNQLKTLLLSICTRRRAYKLREGRFRHSVGCKPISPYIKNSNSLLHHHTNDYPTSVLESGEHVPSMVPTTDWAESEAALEVACHPHSSINLPPISPYDLLEALQVHRSSLPSHSVLSLNVERTIARLWHPSIEELEQESIYRQEEQIRSKLLSEQIGFGIGNHLNGNW